MRFVCFLFIAIVACASPASAELIIDLGNHTLLGNTAGQTIQIFVTSTNGEKVQGLNWSFQIAPDSLTPAAAPTITAFDIVGPGTVFGSNNTGQTTTLAGEAEGGIQMATGYTTTASSTVAASGLLGTVTVDTTGILNGNYTINMDNTLNGPTDFSGVSADSFINGSISISPVGVPEPSGFALALTASGMVLLRRRCRRHASSSNTPCGTAKL